MSDVRACCVWPNDILMVFLGLGTRERLEAGPEQQQERIDKLAGAVRTILECIGSITVSFYPP